MSKSHAFTKEVFKKFALAGILEFGPILVFILSFEYLHIYKATLILMVVTIISTVATYKIQKRLPYLALYIAFITSVFGYMTLASHQPRFIQMRDTLYDVTCALTLIVGLIFNISFLKFAFGHVFAMTDRAWHKLTCAWIAFFIVIAVLNEYVRRNMSLHDWFDFKTAMIFVTIIFGFTALFFFFEKEEK